MTGVRFIYQQRNEINEMITGNPLINAKLSIDSAVRSFQESYKARFLIGDHIISDYFNKVSLTDGKLNFKVKSCGANSTKHQVTFSDNEWAIFDIINNKVSYRCGNLT